MKYYVFYILVPVYVLGVLIPSGMGRRGKKNISKPLELSCDY